MINLLDIIFITGDLFLGGDKMGGSLKEEDYIGKKYGFLTVIKKTD